MSVLSCFDERVPEVRPRKGKAIIKDAVRALRQLQPSALTCVESVEFEGVLGRGLSVRHNGSLTSEVAIYDQPEGRMDGRHAYTAFKHGPGLIDVVLSSRQMDELIGGGPMSRMPRATLAHELGHAWQHGPEVWLQARRSPMELSRVMKPRRSIKSYRDPEWQAWLFATALLMPLGALQQMDELTADALSAEFRVSSALAGKFLRQLERLKILVDDRIVWVP